MIVGLTGLIGSGKDTVADFLIKEHGFIQLSFAEGVKDALSVIFGWDREMLEGKTKEHREARNVVDEWWAKELCIPNFTPRLGMTTFGTDIMRKHFDDDIWVLNIKNKIQKLQEKDPNINIVISDARYRNELCMLRSIDAVLFEISRGEKPAWWTSAIGYNQCNNDFERFLYRLFLKMFKSKNNIFTENIHSSEYDWIGFDFDNTLFNNKTIEDLTKQVGLLISLKKALSVEDVYYKEGEEHICI